jgi:hypothetical protein
LLPGKRARTRADLIAAAAVVIGQRASITLHSKKLRREPD